MTLIDRPDAAAGTPAFRLLLAAADPERARIGWATAGVAELRCGTGVFDALFVTASIGTDTVGLLGRAAGPVLRRDCGQLVILAQPGTLRAWGRRSVRAAQRALAFAARGGEPGDRILVPAPGARGAGVSWYRSPDRPLTESGYLASALCVAVEAAVGVANPAEVRGAVPPRRQAQGLRDLVHAAGGDDAELGGLCDEGRRLAMLRGWRVVGEQAERCDPGVPLRERPGWRRTVADALAGAVNGIVVAVDGWGARAQSGYAAAVDEPAGSGVFVARSGGVL